MELSKEQSTIVKGCAILMMLFHHLFAFPAKIELVTFDKKLVALGLSLKLCVSLFIFISGYGLTKGWQKRGIHAQDISKRILTIYFSYWRYLIPFTIIGMILQYYHFDWHEALLNLLCLRTSYYHESWFIFTYILVLIILPLFSLIRTNTIFIFTAGIFAVILRIANTFIDSSGGLIFTNLYNFNHYFCTAVLGAICARVSIHQRLKLPLFFNKAIFNVILSIIAAIVLTVIRKVTDYTWPTIFLTPFIVYLSSLFINVKYANRILEFFGKYSLGMWLVHGYFLYYYLDFVIFHFTSSPVLCYILLVFLSTILSVCFEKTHLLCKNFWKERSF